jgi:hypothetical protein
MDDDEFLYGSSGSGGNAPAPTASGIAELPQPPFPPISACTSLFREERAFFWIVKNITTHGFIFFFPFCTSPPPFPLPTCVAQETEAFDLYGVGGEGGSKYVASLFF